MLSFKRIFIVFFLLAFAGIIVLSILIWQFNERRVLLLAGILCILILFFFVVLFNFTRRKKAEKDLQLSEQRFGALVDSIKDYAIFMIDPKGNVMSWNQGARRIKGYSADEVIGKPISMFYTDADNATGEPAYNLKMTLEEGHFEAIGWRKRKDGSLFWADAVFTPLYDNTETLTGFIKITKDISLQRLNEEEMQNNLAREKKLNEMKSRFVSLASHEFKTPLSVILSSISLVERYNAPEMEDKRLKHIQRIRNNVNDLKQILNDFLSLDRLEEGLVRNQAEPTDLRALVNDMVRNMQEYCKKDQRILVSISGDARDIMVDVHLLHNVLVNLVSNAVKYSPENSTISLHLQYGSKTVSFSVRDEGIGIPQEEQEHLFERFFRASNTTGTAGTGLGLSIVRRYLELMEGQIRVNSAPGTGTEFTVILKTSQQLAQRPGARD